MSEKHKSDIPQKETVNAQTSDTHWDIFGFIMWISLRILTVLYIWWSIIPDKYWEQVQFRISWMFHMHEKTKKSNCEFFFDISICISYNILSKSLLEYKYPNIHLLFIFIFI